MITDACASSFFPCFLFDFFIEKDERLGRMELRREFDEDNKFLPSQSTLIHWALEFRCTAA
jgi:hypothetical protein